MTPTTTYLYRLVTAVLRHLRYRMCCSDVGGTRFHRHFLRESRRQVLIRLFPFFRQKSHTPR